MSLKGCHQGLPTFPQNADTVTNFDETTEEKKEDLDDSLSN